MNWKNIEPKSHFWKTTWRFHLLNDTDQIRCIFIIWKWESNFSRLFHVFDPGKGFSWGDHFGVAWKASIPKLFLRFSLLNKSSMRCHKTFYASSNCRCYDETRTIARRPRAMRPQSVWLVSWRTHARTHTHTRTHNDYINVRAKRLIAYKQSIGLLSSVESQCLHA